MDAEGQAAEYPEPEKIQLSIPDAGGFENAVQQPGDGDGQNCFVGSWLIFSSMSRFSSSVTQNFIWIFRFRFAMLRRLRFHKGLGLSQQAIFDLGAGVPLNQKSASGYLLAVLATVTLPSFSPSY